MRPPSPPVRRLCLLVIVLVLAATSCSSPRADIESFPPITCTVYEGTDVAGTTVVQVDQEPGTIALEEVTFRADYRSHELGRQLESRVEHRDGEVLQRVSYVVPGRIALRNQFGDDRHALTGEHEILPDQGTGLRWSCGVGRGDGP